MPQPYLFFDGNCEEAIRFYERSLGARLQMLLHYHESPGPGCPGMHENFGDKVMHANLRIGALDLMLADDCMGHPRFEGFALSLTVQDEAEATRKFQALAESGQVLMPLGTTFFSPCFGMLKDRFGVHWMLMVNPPAP